MKKILNNDRVRIKFQHNYNSCNWGYIADFDAKKINDRLFLSCLLDKAFYFYTDDKPIEMEILEWEIIPKINLPILLNCTGNEKWCEKDSTMNDIIKESSKKG